MARLERIIKAPVRERSRRGVREVYKDYEVKREVKNINNYLNVQELASCFYGGIDPRRATEMADGGMIREDQNAMSNLPTKGFQREYPRTGFYSNPYIQTSVKEDL